jgi:hypothetical protein
MLIYRPPMVAPFVKYMQDRDAIRQLKESGVPRPWTDDPILHQRHFVNVSREDDWTTRQLKKDFYDPHSDAPAELQIFNVAIARSVGLYETVMEIGWQEKLDFEHLLGVIDRRAAAGLPVFTPAYQVAAGRSGLIDRIDGIWRKREYLARRAHDFRSMESVALAMTEIKGVGFFMAAQFCLDLALTPVLVHAPDRETFAMPGPGSLMGLDTIFGRPPSRRTGIGYKTYERSREEMKAVMALARKLLPETFKITLSMVEHALCEYSKYLAAQNGRTTRPYKPRVAGA